MAMKPLPDMDLLDRYSHEYANFSQREPPLFRTGSDVLRSLEYEENPVTFKYDLLNLTQLLFDGIVRLPRGGWGFWYERAHLDEKACLTAFYEAGKRCVGSFYRGEPEDTDMLRELLLPHATTIIAYAGRGSPSVRHLRQDSLLQLFGQSLPRMFPGLSGIEVLVGIASGGFEPSFLLMDMLDCPFLPVCYSGVRRNDQAPRVPRLQKCSYFSSLNRKRVLVVDDVVSSGKSLWKVSRRVAQAKPVALYGCAVAGYNEQVFYDKGRALRRLIPSLRPGIMQIGQHFWCSFPL